MPDNGRSDVQDTANQSLDSETAEILESMKKDGIDDAVPFDPSKEADTTSDSKDKPASKDEPEEDEEKPKDEKPEKADLKDDDDSEDDEDEEEEDAGFDPSKTVPISKYLKLKRELKTERKMKTAGEEYRDISRDTDLNDDQRKAKFQELADKYETAPEFLQEVAELIFPQAQRQKLGMIEVEAENKHQLNSFTQDFNTTVLPLIKQEYPDISAQEIEKIQAEIQDKAFSDDLLAVPLPYIYKGLDDFRGKVKTPVNHTAEPEASGRTKGHDGKNAVDMSEEEALAAGDDAFDEWSEAQGKKGSRLNMN